MQQPMQQPAQQPTQFHPTMPQPQVTARTGYTGNVMMPGGMGSSDGVGAGAGGMDVASAVCGTAASALGIDGATASVAGQLATNAASNYFQQIAGGDPIAIGSAYTGSRLAVLRYYFDVNNAYVLQKLKILLLPYRHKDWSRQVSAIAGGGYVPQPPCVDANAPDLYLPLMSFVTYMLVAGFVSGADGRFTPEVLASSGSFGLFMVIFEVCLIKLMLYLLNATGQAGLADLAATAGYKFFFAVVVVLSYAFGGRAAGYVAIGLGGANMGTFFWHTLQQCMIEPGGVALGFMHEAGSPSKTEKKKKQTYSLLVIALLQPLWFWWLLARV